MVNLRAWCSTSVKAGRGHLKSKGKGTLSLHYCGDDETTEVILRTIISVNQLSIHGAAAGHVRRAGLQNLWLLRTYKETFAQNIPESTVIPTELSTTNKTPRTNETVQGNLLHDYEQKIANLPDHVQLTKLCSTVGVTKTVARWTVCHDPRRCGTGQIEWLMSRVHITSTQHIIQSERMDPWEHEDRSSFGGSRQLPSRPLLNRDHDPILVKTMELVLEWLSWME